MPETQSSASFDILVKRLPASANLNKFRSGHAYRVRLIRDLLQYKGEYVRPTHGRRASPFVQTQSPVIARDVLSDTPGEILSMDAFTKKACKRVSPFKTADMVAASQLDPDLAAAIDQICNRGELIVSDRSERLKRLAVIASLCEPMREALHALKSEECILISSN